MPPSLRAFFFFDHPDTPSSTYDTLLPYLPALSFSATLATLLSQFLLNRRLRAFGGDNRSAVLATVAALIFDWVQVVMRPRWGRWKTGDHLLGWYSIEGIGKVLLASQALSMKEA